MELAAPPFKLDTTWSLRKSIPLDEQPWYLAQKKRKPTSVALLTDAQILCAASKKAGVKKRCKNVPFPTSDSLQR